MDARRKNLMALVALCIGVPVGLFADDFPWIDNAGLAFASLASSTIVANVCLRLNNRRGGKRYTGLWWVAMVAAGWVGLSIVWLSVAVFGA
jgi:hypothetical protein